MKKILLFTLLLALTPAAILLAQLKDPDTYAPTANGDKLVNLYLNSSKLANNVPVYPGGVAGDARGMAVTNGKMYFCNRQVSTKPYKYQIVELDGTTGALLRTIDLPIEMLKNGTDTIAYPVNDIQVDDAGNLFLANMTTDMRETAIPPTPTTRRLRVTYVDVNQTPVVWRTVMDATLPAELAAAFRVETFDVSGNVNTGNGFIMAPVSGAEVGAGNVVLKYNVTGGVADAANPEYIVIGGYYPVSVTASGAAPRVNIMGEDNLFYLDGFATYPSLYDMSGSVIDGFQNNTALTPKATGQNGVTEFQINGKYYMIVASTNTDEKIAGPQAFDVFEFADASRSFAAMTFLYRFPTAGMGAYTNPVRTALPRVEVVGNAPDQKARINLYAYRNGYGIYEFGPQGLFTGVDKTQLNGVKIAVKGFDVTLSEPAAEITLYNTTGQKVAEVKNVQTITAPSKGIYIVKAKLADNVEQGYKVVVK